ncbi:unnamed protein product [Clonostachys solani]|uniref:Transcription factor hoxa13 n=1 Tax=Clonostachys solani TaxID=160281 RepID=A0A9N9Z2J4_9HYPO|nr:unnamed protein product [Clonostachys solani]
MADPNGALKAANGFTNGKAKPAGKPAAAGKRRGVVKRRGFLSWLFNHVAWLATWFSILTVLFRCPPSLEACDDTSPFICQYYFKTKTFVAPYVQPYYDEYAAPYVDVAQPYYDTLNQKVLVPAHKYAVQYGTPYVEKAQEFGLAQWERNGQVQLQKIQELVRDRYDDKVGPYITQANDVLGPYIDAAQTEAYQVYYGYLLPGYTFVQPYAVDAYRTASKFTADTALPTASWAWGKTSSFLDTAIWPHLRVIYVENVEPQLVRIGERLGRYGTRVKSKVEELPDLESTTTTSAFSKPTVQSTSVATVEASASETPRVESKETYAQPVQAPAPGENENDKRKKAREMVAQDLEQWQNRFATLADEGANDMEERVDEIAKHMIEAEVKKTGTSLMERLEATAESEVKTLKKKISALVEQSTTGLKDPEEEAVKAVRTAGVAIKQQAQAIREWRKKYDTDLQNTVVNAADAHFKLLDETRGLALQQIGMKWAWTDGVTYKDWQKYHELKTTFSAWTDQLKQLIVTHPALLAAQDASAQVEDESMEIASNAAKELGRLKEVTHWKVLAQDSSDNFSLEEMKLAAEAVEAAAVAAEEARLAAIKAAEEAEEEAKKQAERAAAEARDEEERAARAAEAGEETPSSADFDEAVSGAQDNSEDSADSSLPTSGDENDEEEVGKAEDQEVSESADETKEAEESSTVSSLLSEASEILLSGTTLIVANGSDGSDGSEDSKAPEPPKRAEDIDEDAGSQGDSHKAYETPSAKPVIFGAMAQAVRNRQPILEDYEDTETDEEGWPTDAPMREPNKYGSGDDEWDEPDVYAALYEQADETDETDEYEDERADEEEEEEQKEEGDLLADLTSAAEDAYAKAVSAASDQYATAASVISAQIYGTPKPVHNQLFSSVSAAYDNAVAAASSQFDAVVSAASAGIQGTTTEEPKPTSIVDWQKKVESIAAQRLNEGRVWAEIQYQSAIIALGLATPTPTSNAEKLYSQAKMNYYAGIGLAQDRYSSFLSAASSAMSSLTATPTPTPTDFAGTLSSVASIATESAASVIQAAEDVAGSAYSAAADNVASAIKAVDDSIDSAIDAASEQVYLAGAAFAETWDKVLQTLEGQVYGEQKQIGWYESLFNEASSAVSRVTAGSEDPSATASKQYAAVTDIVSELLVGKEDKFQQSVLSRLQAAYATATSNIGSVASQATEAIKAKVQHDKDEL